MNTQGVVYFLRKIVSKIVDIVLPVRLHTKHTEQYLLGDVPLQISSYELLNSTVYTLMQYKMHVVEDIIQSLKYENGKHAAHLCAEVLEQYLTEEISMLKLFSPRIVMIVPIPLHYTRERERGYNQITRILNKLPSVFHNGLVCAVNTRLLIRTRATEAQARKGRRERLQNVHAAFALKEKINLSKYHIFLIDDVTTTGATLFEASRPLEAAGATVTLLALARA